MTREEAIRILAQAGMVGGYYGPGYHSWHAVQAFMERHPRGRGLPPHGGGRELYAACLVYQADRSRSKSWVAPASYAFVNTSPL